MAEYTDQSLISLLDEIAQTLKEAKSRFPGSTMVAVNRDFILDLVYSAREAVPDQLSRADELLAEAEDAKNGAHQEADDIRALNTLYTTLFTTLSGRGGTVALGPGDEGSLLLELRPSNSGSTVDAPGTIAGNYNTALALAAEIAGQHVDLGSADGASAPFGTRVDAAKHDEG